MSQIEVSKEEWIAALRSDDYEQAREALVRSITLEDKAHCCLGVICELASNVKVNKNIDGSDLDHYHIADFDYKDHYLLGKLGIYRPIWMSRGQELACINANDTLDWTFDQIADWWEFGGGKVKFSKLFRRGRPVPKYNPKSKNNDN